MITLARNLFTSNFKLRDKSQDEELEKRTLLFAGINYHESLELTEYETMLFEHAFKQEVTAEKSKLLGRNRLIKFVGIFAFLFIYYLEKSG